MKLLINQDEKAREFIAAAEKHIGYQARPGKLSTYGELVGHQGCSWAGSFIDVIARHVNLKLPAVVQTNVALAEFIRSSRIYKNPKPGDLVFFNFSQSDDYGMPHVGIVTDVQHFTKHGMFQTIEGETSPGMPKGSQLNDGVYKRNRYAYDVLAFARPNFKRTFSNEAAAQASSSDPGKLPTKTPVIRSSILRPGVRHPSVVHLQLALAAVVGLRGANRGELDHKTMAAVANFQRTIGYVGSEANGIPDVPTLNRLSMETGSFTAAD